MSDKKITVADPNNTSQILYYTADVITANDFYPFGMNMPGRKFAQANSSYRYGFNGQEKSTEINDNSYTAEYWQYDARLGRRFNLDPKPTIGISDYAAFFNNPIFNFDVHGDTPVAKIGGGTYDVNPGNFTTYDGTVRNVKGSSVKVQPAAGTLESFTRTGDNLEGGSITFKAMFGVETGKFKGYFSTTNPDYSYEDYLEEGKQIALNYINHMGDQMWDPTLTKDEARKNFINNGLGVTMPTVLIKPLTIATNIQKIANSSVGRSVGEFVNLFKPMNELDFTKTLYRGTTGSETGSTILFLTDNATVAATYVKNGGQVMSYQMTTFALKTLEYSGELRMATGMHGASGLISTEYIFQGKNLVEAVNKIAK